MPLGSARGSTPARKIERAAIIGAGTMGGGIAMKFPNAGIPVTVVEVTQEALDRGLAVCGQHARQSQREPAAAPRPSTPVTTEDSA